MTDPARALAAEIADLRRRLAAVERAGTLQRASVQADDGSTVNVRDGVIQGLAASVVAAEARASIDAAEVDIAAAQSRLDTAEASITDAFGEIDSNAAGLTSALGTIDSNKAAAISRGTDLVTNGTGMLGNNTNFSSMTYDPADAPVGALGSFVTASTAMKWNDEYIPVDPGKIYRQSVSVRQQVAGVTSRFYVGLVPFDAQKTAIIPQTYVYHPDSVTTLAAPLNPGDTTVSLTTASAAVWALGSYNYIGFWNWKDPTGRVWPVGTYTQNYTTYSAISGTTVTLSSPYAGPALPAGNPLSRNYPGQTYMYTTATNAVAPGAWAPFSSPDIGGVADGRRTTTWGATTAFPPGCAYVKLLILPNYGGANGGSQAFASLSLSDATAARKAAEAAQATATTADSKAGTAQTAANTAQTTANTAQGTAQSALTMAGTKNRVYTSDVAPSGTGSTSGDLWRQHSASGDIIGEWEWNGSSWTSRPISSSAISNLDVGKLTAGTAVVADVVAQKIAAATGQFVKADVGNLVVSQGATISDLVAQTIAAKTGNFIKINADQINAGTLSVDLSISLGAKSVFVHTVADADALNKQGGPAVDFGTGYVNEIRPARILNVQSTRPVLTISASEMVAPGGVPQSEYADDPQTPAYISLSGGTAYDTRDTDILAHADAIRLNAGVKGNGTLNLHVPMGAGAYDDVQLIDFAGNGVYIANGATRLVGPVTVTSKISTADPTHYIGKPGQPAFANGWKNNATTDAQVAYWLDPVGNTVLQGVVSGGALGTTSFVLPAGYRPEGTLNFATAATGGATAQVRILADGSVNVVFGPTGGWYSLSGVRFRAVA